MAILTTDQLYALVRRYGAYDGPDACAVAGALAESGGRTDAKAAGDEDSWGLWQMNRGGGLGAGHTVAELCDPDFAAAIMVPLYVANYLRGQQQGLDGERLARHTYMETERPWGYPNLDTMAANRFADYWRGLAQPPAPPIDHSAILAEARTWLGCPYVWGGQSRNGIDCLVAGTYITTARGQVPIERIRPGDLVFTRLGYRAALAAWQVGTRDVWRLPLADDQALIGTANHKVWTANGWKSLGALRACDKILPCEVKLSSTTGFATTDIPIAPTPRTAITIRAATGAAYTARSGRMHTDPSHQGTKSTTAITTPSTTPWATWSWLRSRPIVQNPLVRGRSTPTLVLTAASGSLAKLATATPCKARIGSALGAVSSDGGRRPDWLTVPSSASGAARRFLSMSPMLGTNATAAVGALTNIVAGPPEYIGRAITYDLEIDGAPEFFANGVLVHNCSGLVIEVLKAVGLWPAAWGDDTAAGIANRFGLSEDWDAIHDGDLLFFDWEDGQGIAHIGFRDGYQHILDAQQPGTVVRERALSAYELDHLAGFACPGATPDPAPPPDPPPTPDPEPAPPDADTAYTLAQECIRVLDEARYRTRATDNEAAWSQVGSIVDYLHRIADLTQPAEGDG